MGRHISVEKTIMKTFILLVLICLSPSAPVFAGLPEGAVYLDGGASKSGLILAHGRGKDPTWLVVDPVRKGIHENLGYHTVSLQMPVGFSDWKEYAVGFPDAYRNIIQAIEYLKNAKGVTRVFLFGHSMGARMSSAFVFKNPNSGLSGLVVAGCRNNGGSPLACDQNLEWIKLPVLDIWGGNNDKDAEAAAERNRMVSNTYTQVEIPGANHKFEGYEDKLVNAVSFWLERQD